MRFGKAIAVTGDATAVPAASALELSGVAHREPAVGTAPDVSLFRPVPKTSPSRRNLFGRTVIALDATDCLGQSTDR